MLVHANTHVDNPPFEAVEFAAARGLAFWERLMLNLKADIRFYDSDFFECAQRYILRDTPTDRFDDSEIDVLVEGSRLLTTDFYYPKYPRNSLAFNVATLGVEAGGVELDVYEIADHIQSEVTIPDEDAEVIACLAHMATTASDRA